MQGESLNMTDQQIVTALTNRDKDVTRVFFYIKCYPLFNSILKHRSYMQPIKYARNVN